MKPRRAVSIIIMLVLLLAIASPAYAQGGGRPGMVSFGRDIEVAEGETINGDVVAFGGNVTVGSRAAVNGAVVSFGGNVSSAGEVSESVVSFGGNIELKAGSVTREDVVALGGEVMQAEGARVLGNVSKGYVFSLDGGQPGQVTWPRVRVPTDIYAQGPQSVLAALILGVLRAMLTVLVLTAIAVVLVAIFPRQVQGVRSTLEAQPGASAGIGCLAYLAAMALTIPLILTCFGPFLLWTAVAVAAIFGLAALGLWLGDRLSASAGGRMSSLASAALGTALIVLLLAILDAVPFLSCFAWVLWVLVGSLALGAAVWSRFGTQLPGGVAQPAAPAGPSHPAGAYPPESPIPGALPDSEAASSTTPSEIARELAAAEESKTPQS